RRLAIGYFNGEIEVRGLTPTAQRPILPLAPSTNAGPNLLLSGLGSEQADEGFQALWKLVSSPEESVPLLGKRHKPAHTDQHRLLEIAIAELGNREFGTRQRAEQRLRKLGASIEPALRAALDQPASADMRKRLTEILASVVAEPRSGEYLRESRAIAVLEMVGTDEARRLLKELASGASGFSLTEDAKAALKRLER